MHPEGDKIRDLTLPDSPQDRGGGRPSPAGRTVMVSGCTGFIGSRLAARLSSLGYAVRGLTRQKMKDCGNIKYVRADVFDLPKLRKAMEGAEVAYYLLHSMEGSRSGWQDFTKREREQAQNFLKAATSAGVKRIIYLGGLASGDTDLSPHMKSRKEVGRILASGGIPVTELRASLIIGAHGGSFLMLQHLVERLRVMVCPSWVGSYAQPIAVDDVVAYLVGCLEKSETSGRIFEIGGPDRVTYEQLMRIYASYRNRRMFVLRIPFLTTRLSSLWVDLITPIRASLARPLVDSLIHDTIVTDPSITRIIRLKRKNIAESIDAAVKETGPRPCGAGAGTRGERTGFGLNQKTIMISLLALGICGTSYYWLDDRPAVYEPGWVLASAAWYAVIGFAAIMTHNKTRLGYMVAGILSWVTLSFWLFDNLYVLFGASPILAEPNAAMTARNFAGALVAAATVVASHNLFHKSGSAHLSGAR